MIVKTLLFFLLSSTIFVHGQQTKRVLFLGNSYTSYNQLPVLIDNLANANGHDIIHDSNTPGGQRLVQHASNPSSLSKIKAQDWDYVVIQAQSQEPSFSPTQVANNTYPYAAILNDSILSNNPCTEPLFYMTWGRKNGDASNCGTYPPICTYEGMQQRLRESYMEMAQDNNASVAPVGVAWQTVRDLYPSIELYNSDQSHPSLAGSYLAACVFYVSIFRESVLGNTFTSSLDSLTAYRLQNIASTTVIDSLSLWEIGVNDLSLSLPADTSLCADSLNITAQSIMGNLFWSTGETSTSITLQNSTLIYASVTNARTCNIADSLNVSLNTGFNDTTFYETCDSFELNGVLYFEDTIVSETFVLVNACDSIFVQALRIVTIPDISPVILQYTYDSLGIYIQNADYDSIYSQNNLTGAIYINEDTIIFYCDFNGFIKVWNACGLDSAAINSRCAAILELGNSWQIGPNPIKESILIANSDNKGFAVSIKDLLGREVLQEAYQNTDVREVQIENIPQGVYFMILYDKQGKAIGKKTIQKQ
jgi:hypothetical protein